MTNVLLIIIAVMVLITMICSITTTTLVVNKSGEKVLVLKVLKVLGIILIVLALIGVAIGSSYLKNDEKSNNNVTSQGVTLETAGFKSVSVDEYLELLNGSEKSIILVARPTCSFCEKFTPILKQAKDDMNLTVNYVNTDNFTSDDWTKFEGSLDYFSNEEWGTPLVLIVQNGEAVAVNSGYVELDTIKEFFTNNGFGK